MRRSHKTYSITSLAPGAATPQLTQNPARISLTIQNTGGAAGIVRFGSPNQGVGLDFGFAAAEKFKWDQADTCPTEAVFFAGATTWCVMEGNDDDYFKNGTAT